MLGNGGGSYVHATDPNRSCSRLVQGLVSALPSLINVLRGRTALQAYQWYLHSEREDGRGLRVPEKRVQLAPERMLRVMRKLAVLA